MGLLWFVCNCSNEKPKKSKHEKNLNAIEYNVTLCSYYACSGWR